MTYHNENNISGGKTLPWINGNNSHHLGDDCLKKSGFRNASFSVGVTVNSGSAGAGDKIICEGTVGDGSDIIKLQEYDMADATTAGDMLLIPISNRPLRAVRLRIVQSGATDININSKFIVID